MNLSSGAIIKGILGLQLAIGLALVVGDMSAGQPRLPSTTRAPDLDQPVRPGDQTRRFRQVELPDVPNRPFPALPEMPERLGLAEVELEGSRMIRMVGHIAAGDGSRVAPLLREYFAAEDAPEGVLIHSPGGSVEDALALGRLLRSMDLPTVIAPGDICFSACPYIFAGGAERSVHDGGALGVHQHYFGENTVLPAFLAVEDIQRGQGQVMAYLSEMGLDPLLMQHALATPPEEIYIFVRDELERYGIVTDEDASAT